MPHFALRRLRSRATAFTARLRNALTRKPAPSRRPLRPLPPLPSTPASWFFDLFSRRPSPARPTPPTGHLAAHAATAVLSFTPSRFTLASLWTPQNRPEPALGEAPREPTPPSTRGKHRRTPRSTAESERRALGRCPGHDATQEDSPDGSRQETDAERIPHPVRNLHEAAPLRSAVKGHHRPTPGTAGAERRTAVPHERNEAQERGAGEARQEAEPTAEGRHPQAAQKAYAATSSNPVPSGRRTTSSVEETGRPAVGRHPERAETQGGITAEDREDPTLGAEERHTRMAQNTARSIPRETSPRTPQEAREEEDRLAELNAAEQEDRTTQQTGPRRRRTRTRRSAAGRARRAAARSADPATPSKAESVTSRKRDDRPGLYSGEQSRQAMAEGRASQPPERKGSRPAQHAAPGTTERARPETGQHALPGESRSADQTEKTARHTEPGEARTQIQAVAGSGADGTAPHAAPGGARTRLQPAADTGKSAAGSSGEKDTRSPDPGRVQEPPRATRRIEQAGPAATGPDAGVRVTVGGAR